MHKLVAHEYNSLGVDISSPKHYFSAFALSSNSVYHIVNGQLMFLQSSSKI